MGFFFVVVVMIVVLAVFIPLAIAQSRQTNEAWSAAARQLGLRYQPAAFFQSRQISGRRQNFSVTVDTYTVSSGNNQSRTYTRFRLTFPSLGLGLKLQREGFFSGITKFFGAQDIQVGEAQFDGELLIKGANPKRIREFLTPARRMRIHQFLRSHDGATITDHEIAWRTGGVIRETARLIDVIRSFERLAWHLTGDRENDHALGRALEAQDEGRPDEALALLEDLNITHEPPLKGDFFEPDSIEEQFLKGELLYLADRRSEAREAFQAAQQTAPANPELAEWADHVAESPGEPVSAGAENAVDEAIDVANVCRELFVGEKMSYEVSRLFEQTYAGKTVRWSGNLRRVESYAFELVFGNNPGCKAVIAIHQLESTAYGDQTVSAVVQFPKEQLEQLRKIEGQSLRFEGQLKKVDALMRNFYIANGKLTD